MDYTIISKNSQNESKLFVTHIDTDDSVDEAIRLIGADPADVVVFKGRHYLLLPEELT